RPFGRARPAGGGRRPCACPPRTLAGAPHRAHAPQDDASRVPERGSRRLRGAQARRSLRDPERPGRHRPRFRTRRPAPEARLLMPLSDLSGGHGAATLQHRSEARREVPVRALILSILALLVPIATVVLV